MQTISPSVLEAQTLSDLQRCFPVMRELRPHLTLEAFLQQVQRQQQQVGYRLMYLAVEGTVLSALGYRISEYLAWGKVLYIDDLITSSSARRCGHASALLHWACATARAQACDQVHLDSGHQRTDAHRLYAQHGFTSQSHHFALGLNPS